MNRIRSVSVQRGPIGELHHAAKPISLRAGRHVDTNPSLQQAWNLPLQSTNFHERAYLLILAHARLPAKCKSMNDHASIVTKVDQIE